MIERVDAVVAIQGVSLAGEANYESPAVAEIKAVPVEAVKILRYPHSKLITRCTESQSYKQNIDSCRRLTLAMTQNFKDFKNNKIDRQALGLSSNQIGDTETRCFTLDKQHLHIDHNVFVNPKILEFIGNPELMLEGCMSFPDIQVSVSRYTMIRLEYCNTSAHKFVKTFSGLAAHAIQHEIDHLNGITIYQNASDKHKKKIRLAIEHARTKR